MSIDTSESVGSLDIASRVLRRTRRAQPHDTRHRYRWLPPPAPGAECPQHAGRIRPAAQECAIVGELLGSPYGDYSVRGPASRPERDWENLGRLLRIGDRHQEPSGPERTARPPRRHRENRVSEPRT